MYTILVTKDNELVVSVKERIMQRSKLVDKLHFLVDPMYKDLDMTNFTVYMEYLTPQTRLHRSEILEKSEELYKEHLEYTLPFDTCLTKEEGQIEIQLTFISVDLDEEGKDLQYVRKTTPTTITITPISAWSDVVPDSSLNAIDQRILKTEAQIKALEEMNNIMAVTKADNIAVDDETHELYLTSEGNQIGDRIHLEDFGDVVVSASTEGLIQVITDEEDD